MESRPSEQPATPPVIATGSNPPNTNESPFRACILCRDAHTACDGRRPCRRCSRLGKERLCRDAPARKRGRRPLLAVPVSDLPVLLPLPPPPASGGANGGNASLSPAVIPPLPRSTVPSASILNPLAAPQQPTFPTPTPFSTLAAATRPPSAPQQQPQRPPPRPSSSSSSAQPYSQPQPYSLSQPTLAQPSSMPTVPQRVKQEGGEDPWVATSAVAFNVQNRVEDDYGDDYDDCEDDEDGYGDDCDDKLTAKRARTDVPWDEGAQFSPQGTKRMIDELEKKMSLLTQLVEMMSDEMHKLRADNKQLLGKMKKMKAHHRRNDQALRDLLSKAEHNQSQPVVSTDASSVIDPLSSSSSSAFYSSQVASWSTNHHSVMTSAFQQQQQRQGVFGGTDRLSSSFLLYPSACSSTPTVASVPPGPPSSSSSYSSSSSSSSTSPVSSSSSPPSPTARSPRSSFSFELSVLHSGVSPALLLEARQMLPFLCAYDISPSRFAIHDPRYPVCVSINPLGDTPPIVVYVNDAFVHLVGFAREELIGFPYTNVGAINPQHQSGVAELIRKPPMTAGDLFSFMPLVRCKSGRLLRLNDRCQFFYDQEGNPHCAILCATGWHEDTMKDGECFNKWEPLRQIMSSSSFSSASALPRPDTETALPAGKHSINHPPHL